MATSTAVQDRTTRPDRPFRLKTKQHGAWSSGDYAVVGTTLQIVGEELCEALDLRAGQKCSTSPPATAVRSPPRAAGCEVIDRLCAEPARARPRARRGGRPVGAVPGSRCRGARLRRRDFRCRALDLRRDVHAGPGPRGFRIAAGVQERRQDRSRQLDAGWLYRAVVQDARQVPAAARRRRNRRRCGELRRASRRCSERLQPRSRPRSVTSPSATARRCIFSTCSGITMARR